MQQDRTYSVSRVSNGGLVMDQAPAKRGMSFPPWMPPAVARHSTPGRGYEIAKRTFDVTVGTLLLVGLAPLMLVTAFLVGTTSSGPAIFRQQRCGRAGGKFTCYKFRTMIKGASLLKPSLLSDNETTGPVFKMRNDPRITPLGRVLRKTSIDELPQLLNVVRGDMSFVGPRPALPEEVAAYTPRDRVRLSVAPGITCLWQVSGRSNIGFEQWVNLDLEYVSKRSFWFDIWLLARTIPAVVTGRGAV